MCALIVGAGKLLVFSVILFFLATRLQTVFSICYLRYLQGKTTAKIIRLIVLAHGACKIHLLGKVVPFILRMFLKIFGNYIVYVDF